MSVAIVGPIYSFDTSALIDGIERFYPLANFPALWECVDVLIVDGRLRVSEEAWTEALAADAPLREWCAETGSDRDACVYPTNPAVASIAGAIAHQFPRWARQGRKNNADPFVIAVGEVNDWMVISGETNGGPGKPRIPYVCSQRNVAHGRFVDVVIQEGWVFK